LLGALLRIGSQCHHRKWPATWLACWAKRCDARIGYDVAVSSFAATSRQRLYIQGCNQLTLPETRIQTSAAREDASAVDASSMFEARFKLSLPPPRMLQPLNLSDLIGLGSAWSIDFYGSAFGLAN
jgi:hypothetical protein